MYLHFGCIYSEMGKENKLAFRNYIIYLHLRNKKTQKDNNNSIQDNNNSENVLPMNTLHSSELT